MSTAEQAASQDTAGSARFHAIPPSRYLESRSGFMQKAQRVLLVADGEGRNSVWCAEKGLIVDAFDASESAVEKARQLADARGVSVMYNVSSVETWNWQPEQYDAVIIINANFAPPAMRAVLFENCIHTLKPGGILILKGYGIKQLAVLMRESFTPEQIDAFMPEGLTLEGITPSTILNGVAIGEHYYSEESLREAFSALQILEIADYREPARKKDGAVRVEKLMGMVARKMA
ncbi:class I SAM-dependent methyltransferase [Oxalobacter vibrioformis]|uniref:Class I SAM-dependent methyltransferase n=1 Tax=Oxalobacter vibrioformis TaxID=933080 RepID=A0A9E9LZI1_9BURK|nr:class I SAM-dependent methyltransferase [Oxalobacter vibrioformis]NLC24886.1 class I SAM-dependent methyltransferase [Oxalobacter sp.]WAW10098.1 class I SAM-dependent methyltransferase [Oxalobacter vibrioformis]